MKPVLVLQHLSTDGPAYLRTWLRRQGRAFEVFNIGAGQAFPPRIGAYSALAVLGGEMSANDPLPSLRDAERLIVEAVDADIPVIGHCLGGQLMARAFGARVGPSPAPEVGWHRIELSPGPQSSRWFGEHDELTVFQWHYDAFELPHGAVSLAKSDACRHQAFSIGRHLAMQFHVEVDEAKLEAWAVVHDRRVRGQDEPASIHESRRMLDDAKTCLDRQQGLADRVYSTWLA